MRESLPSISVVGLVFYTLFYLISCKSLDDHSGDQDTSLKNLYDSKNYYLFLESYAPPHHHRAQIYSFLVCVTDLRPEEMTQKNGSFTTVVTPDELFETLVLNSKRAITASTAELNCTTAFIDQDLRPVHFANSDELHLALSMQKVQEVSRQTDQFKNMVGLDEMKVAKLQKIWPDIIQYFVPQLLPEVHPHLSSTVELLKIMLPYFSVAFPEKKIYGYCYPAHLSEPRMTCFSYHPELGIRRVFEKPEG